MNTIQLQRKIKEITINNDETSSMFLYVVYNGKSKTLPQNQLVSDLTKLYKK